MKTVVPDIIVVYCVLHCYDFASTTLPEVFKEVLSTAVKAVNFICGRALQHPLLKAFCEEVGKNYSALLLHTEVRWLSKGRLFNRVMELSQEMAIFLQEGGHPKAINFKDEKFLLILFYLANIFGHLNALNVSFQGENVNLIFCCEKI